MCKGRDLDCKAGADAIVLGMELENGGAASAKEVEIDGTKHSLLQYQPSTLSLCPTISCSSTNSEDAAELTFINSTRLQFGHVNARDALSDTSSTSTDQDGHELDAAKAACVFPSGPMPYNDGQGQLVQPQDHVTSPAYNTQELPVSVPKLVATNSERLRASVDPDDDYCPDPRPPKGLPARCTATPKLCLCEVRLHNTRKSCWLVANKCVYDVTSMIVCHPGGECCILRKAGGQDCTEDMNFHTSRARKQLEAGYIGKLEPCGEVVDTGGVFGMCMIM